MIFVRFRRCFNALVEILSWKKIKLSDDGDDDDIQLYREGSRHSPRSWLLLSLPWLPCRFRLAKVVSFSISLCRLCFRAFLFFCCAGIETQKRMLKRARYDETTKGLEKPNTSEEDFLTLAHNRTKKHRNKYNEVENAMILLFRP